MTYHWKKLKVKVICTFAVIWACLSLSIGPALADFAAGLQAFDGGDYGVALEN